MVRGRVKDEEVVNHTDGDGGRGNRYGSLEACR